MKRSVVSSIALGAFSWLVQAAQPLIEPVVTKIVQPEYTPEAKKANISGTVLLTALIDENGFPRHLHLVSPSGMVETPRLEAKQGVV